MNNDIESKQKYCKLDNIDKPIVNNQENKKGFENERIETILIKINSSSGKFQIRVLFLFCLYNFFMGAHLNTFIFMFLSPKFFVKNQSNESKSNVSNPSSLGR